MLAQSQLIQKGDRHFEEMAYIQALEYYQKANARDSLGQETKLKIAECYRLLNDPVNAEKWYAKVVNTDIALPQHRLYYAEALNSNGKHAQAKLWYDRYLQEQGQERRAQNRIEGIENPEEFYKNETFLTIEEAPFNSGQSDFSPAFYSDGLVFSSARDGKGEFPWDNSGYLDLYFLNTTTREISPLPGEVNSRYHEGTAAFFDDDSKVVFTRSNYQDKKLGRSAAGVNKLKLFYAEKQDNGKWSEATLLPFNNNEYSCGHPAMGSDGTLYFSSDMPGGYGGTDLYRSQRINGEWQKPVNLGPVINTEGNEMFPFIYNDTQLFFASNGHPGLGGLDVFGLAMNKGVESQITNLGFPINTTSDDFGLITNAEGQSGYFSSNREGGTGNDDIYTFSSSKPLLNRLMVKGVVTDKMDGTAIADAQVVLKDDEGAEEITAHTDGQGQYSFVIQADTRYHLSAMKESYTEQEESFGTVASGTKNEWVVDFALRKEYDFNLLGVITDKRSEKALEGVQVVLVDNENSTILQQSQSDPEGAFRYVIGRKHLNDELNYQIKLAKEGYLSKSKAFVCTLTKPGQIQVNDSLDLHLPKSHLGADISELIDMNPIFFDLGKHNIRPDAAVELNKIVQYMNENPNVGIQIGSHSDARGSAESNLSLSDKRAKASAEYVISQGISRERISGKGFGESKIVNRCTDGVNCAEEEHQQNRRTEVRVVSE